MKNSNHYNALTTPPFELSLKKLIHKYPKSKNDVSGLIEHIEKAPMQGDSIPGFAEMRC